MDDDEYEDEANADLTLGILSKAHRRPPTELSLSPKTRGFFASEQDNRPPPVIVLSDGEASVEIASVNGVKKRQGRLKDEEEEEEEEDRNAKPKRRKGELSVLGKGTSMSDPVMILDPAEEDGKYVNKLQKKKKKKKQNKERHDEDGDAERGAVAVSATDLPIKEATPPEESLTVRKLLRQPRYFDPPEDVEEGYTCYNCGEAGHFAADCTAERVPKPCYVCGEFSHLGRRCTQNTVSCHICKKVGHRVKDCPEKRNGSRVVCLHCGDANHQTSSCRSNYTQDDIKAAQCYVCKEFGHLCCLDGLENFPKQASCYNCGETGHTGLGCAKSRNGSATPMKGNQLAQCYKCGGEGHFARACSSQTDEVPLRECEDKLLASKHCFKCGGEGHLARECGRKTAAEDKRSGGPQCFKCGVEGHFARDCGSQADDNKPPPPATSAAAAKQCFRCGAEGHFARDCGIQADESCFKCGLDGHFARDCNQERRAAAAAAEDTRGTKLPRWMELQMNQQQRLVVNQKHHRAETAVRLPKWYSVESRQR